MTRKIIKIDEERCNGCGICAEACQEGAIGMVDGKAKLLRDDYCDGLGNCLPACPTAAISFEEREAAAFDEAAVAANMQTAVTTPEKLPCGCPGTQSKMFAQTVKSPQSAAVSEKSTTVTTQLMQWPVQIKLVPVNAPYFEGANLLIAADCAAYAYGNFHSEFMKNCITIIGCPKLDEGDYSEKLTAILEKNDIKSVTVARMEVPCCGGIENAAKSALRACGKLIQWRVVTLSTDGKILEN